MHPTHLRHPRIGVSTVSTVYTGLALALALASCGPGSGQDQPPDVVVFTIDTLRADWIQPLGFDGPTTPHMNALAKESVVFEQAHSPGPWTLPSVVSIFTGRHLAEHSVVRDGLTLDASLPTLATLLADWNYVTASYYRNPYAGAVSGLDRGFDVSEHAARPTEGPELDAFYDRGALQRPYFLYVHNTEPHDPHVSRPRFLEEFGPFDEAFLKDYGQAVKKLRQMTRIDFIKKRELGTTDNTAGQDEQMQRLADMQGRVFELYSASVRDADERLGSVIKKIKQRGRWDHTLFILVSDHGEEMGDHGGWQHDQSVYQELIHVPLIVHFPKGRFAGRRISEPVSLVDVLPTVLDVTGCPSDDAAFSGRSLMPLLEDPVGTDGELRLVSMRINQKKYYRPYREARGDLNLALREGRWKAIYNVDKGEIEIYDLSVDPDEQHDLSDQQTERAERYQRFAAQTYADLVRNARSAGEGDLSDYDADVLQRLRDLGYLGDEEEESESPDPGEPEASDPAGK